MGDTWGNADSYERFMGRWSRKLPPLFLQWFEAPAALTWLDLGCGTGVLSEAIYQHAHPKGLICVDPSPAFLEKAKERVNGDVKFMVGSGGDIPMENDSVDLLVSGLALNFFPDLSAAFVEMKRVVKPDGIIAAYLWDLVSGGMEFLNVFWKAVSETDPGLKEVDERNRFPICDMHAMRDTFKKAGLIDIRSTQFSIDTPFRDFEDYWEPFLKGQGPAGTYLAGLDEHSRDKIRMVLHDKLGSGPIDMTARAIAVSGRLPA